MLAGLDVYDAKQDAEQDAEMKAVTGRGTLDVRPAYSAATRRAGTSNHQQPDAPPLHRGAPSMM